MTDYRTGKRQSQRFDRVQSHTPHSINSVQPNISKSDFGDIRIPNRDSRSSRSVHARGYKQFSTYDTSAIRPKKSKLPKIIAAVVILLLVVGAVMGVMRFFDFETGDNPNLVSEGENVSLTIEQGASSKDIAQKLYDAGLIISKAEFNKEVKAQNAGSSLKAGTYTFAGGTSIADIVKTLVKGSNAVYTLTIPEGTVRATIADLVQTVTKNEVSAAQFLEASEDAAQWLGEFAFLSGVGSKSLEGFLYPETYYIDYGSSAQDIVRMMLKQYETVIATLDFSYPTNAGLSAYDALILASIVEREGIEPETKHIAGVFYNRLSTNDAPTFGYLESDATTAYVVGREPTADEVHNTDDPYSTYENKGLPPTPICNPGYTSLSAICNPQVDNAFFFFSYKDESGATKFVFSETLAEHEKGVETYLR